MLSYVSGREHRIKTRRGWRVGDGGYVVSEIKTFIVLVIEAFIVLEIKAYKLRNLEQDTLPCQ